MYLCPYSNYIFNIKRFKYIFLYSLYSDECFVVTKDLHVISVTNSEDEDEAEIRLCTRYSQRGMIIVAAHSL